jgi:hypothetical protein
VPTDTRDRPPHSPSLTAWLANSPVRARFAEAGGVAAATAVLTGVLALSVLAAPTERIFGFEIAGRHHDPFTVMRQFELGFRGSLYNQPVTDAAGTLLAKSLGGVAAYNLLVLITFPLAAATTYLLARYLALSRAAAAFAALAFAFSPFHLAHAAYHPHIAQVQWLPLYLLALWRCLDAATPAAVAVLGLATATVTLSNFYGGLIAAVLTPVAIAAYWLPRPRAGSQPIRQLGVTVATLLVLAAAGAAYVTWSAPGMLAGNSELAFPRIDLFRYSAKWWSYFVPPVAHPVLGPAASRFWEAEGGRLGMVEQQVSLGWAVVVLGLIAIAGWRADGTRRSAALARVPALAMVAAAALLCSLSPERVIGEFTFVRPSALIYEFLPMFRSYARFGVAVQLMAVLLAGIGVDVLWRLRSRLAKPACAALVMLGAAEYAVSPASLSRDVLPTTAHRWVMQQAGAMQVLDCAPLTHESSSVSWLTNGRIAVLGEQAVDCYEPNAAAKLAAYGYTHLIVRRPDRPGRTPIAAGPRTGLRLDYESRDAVVMGIDEPKPAVYTTAMSGFSAREYNQEWSWRWMGQSASWTIANTTPHTVAATLNVELSAFAQERRITVLLDQKVVHAVTINPERRSHRIGPFLVGPGMHELRFQAVEPPTVADALIHNRDRRPLSVAIGTWTWQVEDSQP